MRTLRIILEALASVLKALFPKSRWANAVYFIIGFLIASWAAILTLLDQLKELF